MKSYGQFCPVAKASELFCERWTPLIVRDLAWGATRFSELQRGVPLMSPTLLSKRLKQLEAEGVVKTRPQANGRGKTYHLTESGREFIPMIVALGTWGQRWSRRQLVAGEVDLGLLVWALERSVNADAFGKSQSLVRIEFTDQPRNQRLWWFINREGVCELCLEDPGFAVDLYLAATLPDMIYIVRGDLPLSRALASGRLEALGTARARKALRGWLNLSPLSKIKPQNRFESVGAPRHG
ncbi:helix-turn-helix domain-containing protein [Pelagibius sp. 7325]|uniref:winged helix-turn-helix transcriptional regulator n=1 Tax=Pelagibius sp. 7325 TaxID=3131994 RepID=UPI0030EDC21D